jgi:hypothetical protein
MHVYDLHCDCSDKVNVIRSSDASSNGHVGFKQALRPLLGKPADESAIETNTWMLLLLLLLLQQCRARSRTQAA